MHQAEDFEKFVPRPIVRQKDRSDRATNEQVLDHRTRVVLAKFIRNGTIKELHGAVSTGKEANVYHAFGETFELAVKIFKTSILIFKDRSQYIASDYRYRRGYSGTNPRKMVKLWAEKEMRNLKRVCEANIPCPRVVNVKNNVLVMEFIGEDGNAAPRLKDAGLNEDEKNEAYRQVVWIMHQMYNVCKMVHADLSEYNLLWWKDKVYVIDVGQSVELSHLESKNFLRMDCVNISTYFSRLGVHTLSPKDLFYTITNRTIREEDVEGIIKEHFKDKWDPDDEVFLNSYIPASLGELNQPMRDTFQPKKMTGVLFLPDAMPHHVKLAPLQIEVHSESASDSEKEEMERKRMKKLKKEFREKKEKEEKEKEMKENMNENDEKVDEEKEVKENEMKEVKPTIEIEPKEIEDDENDNEHEDDAIESDNDEENDDENDEDESSSDISDMDDEERKEFIRHLKDEKKVDKGELKKQMKEHKKEYKKQRREKLKNKIPKKKKEQMIKKTKRNKGK